MNSDLLNYYGLNNNEKITINVSNEAKTDFGKKICSAIFHGELIPGSLYQRKFEHDALCKSKKGLDRLKKVVHIKLLSEWLKNKNVTLCQILQSDELMHAFTILKDVKSSDDNFKTCGKLLTSIILAIDFKPDVEKTILKEILSLQIILPYLSENNESEKIKSLCTLFVLLAENHMTKMRSPYSNEIVYIILKFAPHYKLAPLTFNFWKKLMTSAKKAEFSKQIEELVLNLAFSYYQMTLACDISAESNDDYLKNQEKWAIIIHDASKIINAQNAFDYFYRILMQPGISKIEADVCLFVIENLAEQVDSKDRNFVLQLVKLILTSDESSLFMKPYLSILRQLSVWISTCVDILEEVLIFLAKKLEIEDFVDLAAHALKDICIDCKQIMIPQIGGLFYIYENINKTKLTEQGQADIIKGIATAISYLPNDECLIEMRKLVFMQVQKITNHRSLKPNEYIDQLTVIFKSSKPSSSSRENNPAALVFMENWKNLKEMLNFYKNDEVIVEKLVKCVEAGLKNFKIQLHPILNDVVLLILNLENIDLAISLSIRLCETLDSSFPCELLTIFEIMATKTFDALRNDSNFNTSLSEKLFDLALVVFSKIPLQFIQTPSVINTFELAIYVYNVMGENSCALKLVHELLTVDTRCDDNLRLFQLEIMGRYGGQIILILLGALFSSYETQKFQRTARIFHAMKSASSDAFNYFLNDALSRIPNRTINGKIIAKFDDYCKQFANSMSNPLTSKTDQQQFLTSFTSLFRASE